ncbi:nucleotidyltransferase domain-containing protein [Providencia vermicola]|uniref:nucleotidyltransferase domain-containing protein n=1 Tax=Providencia TaxID=586 RepID=UPI0012B5FB5F|nr:MULTISPECIES: nucleotidyltransferase domain-containing protein [Providencia]MTB39673.1 nucleotidyltransferase domain-containing protein [Providencia sp. wls1949]MTC08332.1 nucleotidyltransferase domain-containing protein [Providencia sp. wls1948]QIC15151.1 nucleotidyltransferase domain-containing protein [Providencia vermicola]
MAVDENGYISTLNNNTTQTTYQGIVSFVQAELLAEYGEAICSIFIYGSVARGHAIPSISDLDLCVIFNNNISENETLALEHIAQNSIQHFPIIPKIDFDIATKQEVLAPSNINSWGYWLKHHCRIIYGEDLSLFFPRFRPSRDIALAVNSDYHSVLLEYRQKIANTDDHSTYLTLSKQAAKKLIRSTNILRTFHDNDWPDTLSEHVSRLSGKYPKLEQQLPFFIEQIQLGIHSKHDFIAHLQAALTCLLQEDKSIMPYEKT